MTRFSFRAVAPFFSLTLLLAVVCAPSALAGGTPTTIHLIVVSGEPSPGMSMAQAMNDLKAGFIEMAGGYTDMGDTSGGTEVKEGVAESSANTTFIVAAPNDMTEEFTALGKRLFNGDKPFILTWQGAGNF